MASKLKTFKLQTYEKLKKFRTEFPTRQEFRNAPQYESFVNSFLNSVEREHIDIIVDMVYNDRSYEDVRSFIQRLETYKIPDTISNADETMESDDEYEAFFMLKDRKVVEVDSVRVIIGDDDTDDNAESKNESSESKTETKDVTTSNTDDGDVDESDDQSDTNRVITLGEIIKSRHSDEKENEDDTEKNNTDVDAKSGANETKTDSNNVKTEHNAYDQYTITSGVASETVLSRLSALW